MTWQLCENQSNAVLDQSMVTRLSDYLQGREAHLSQQIIQAVQFLEGVPSLPRMEGLESIHLDEAIEEIFKLTIKLGGTLSGEHGVGLTKAPYIDLELSQGAIEVMKKIKDVLDPNNILNPGKIFNAPHSLSPGGPRR